MTDATAPASGKAGTDVPFLYEENHAIAGLGITGGYAAGFYKDFTVSR